MSERNTGMDTESLRAVSYAEIVAHVYATMDYRWYPWREFVPSRFAARFARKYRFLRDHKRYSLIRSVWFAVAMSCKTWFTREYGDP